MAKNSIFRNIFRTSVFGVFLSLLVFFLFADRISDGFALEQSKTSLKRITSLAAEMFTEKLDTIDYDHIDRLLRRLDKQSATRFTIINDQGKVLADSRESAAAMGSHFDRQEFQDALKYGSGQSVRYSKTLHDELVYSAQAIQTASGETIVIRCAFPLARLKANNQKVFMDLLKVATITLIITAGASALLARNTIRPLRELRDGAERFARGDLAHKLPVSDTYEIGALSRSMNYMAAELEKQISRISVQQHRQETILSSMSEAVIAVDSELNVILANSAARELFDIHDDYIGKHCARIVRNTQIEQAIEYTAEKGSCEKDVTILRNGLEHTLRLYGTDLKSDNGSAAGSLLVLNDITEIRRLENIRRDFVANVSHELKTPVTSIKGFAELLEEGALDDPENAKKFIGIIVRQTARLEAIITDLLALSRLDQQGAQLRIGIEMSDIAEIVSGSIQLCAHKAASKGIELETALESAIAPVNPNLFEQAITNLIDNAIKYSEQGSKVVVSMKQTGSEVLVSVKDHGCGIPQSEQTRIFERFYRVDKGRSRDMGGTGLGLSIVKHIIGTVHGGKITLESKTGAGSTFTLHMPKVSPFF
ncbi:MAG: ATP-binding protein [Phycisphaerae bacterium]